MKWPTVSLGDVAQVRAGGGAPQDMAAFSHIGAPFIRAGSLQGILENGTVSVSERLTSTTAEKYGLDLFPVNTVIFAKSGMSAKLGRVYRLTEPAYIVNHLAAVICSDKIDPGYLTHWLRTFCPASMIRDEAYPSIRLEDINLYKLRIPNIPEQQRIAAILDQVEALRAKRRKALAKLDTLIQSLFLEMFGDPASNGSIWPVHRIGELDLHISDGNYSSKYPTSGEFAHAGIPFIRANNIQNLTLTDNDLRFITPAKHRELKKGHLVEGDVLITTRGEIGKVAIVPSAFHGANINAQIVLLRPTSLQINSRYLAHLLNSPQMRTRLKGYQNGVALQQLPIHLLTRIPLPIPPLELQSLFASRTMPIENLRLSYGSSLINLDRVFTSLQHRAFRGEL